LALSVLGSRLDLLESRDVIGHVTIRLTIGHFLLVVLWTQDYLKRFLRYSTANVTQWLIWP